MRVAWQHSRVDASSWLDEHATFRTPQAEFACRDGCGFCCTYPPKVEPERQEAIEDENGPVATFDDRAGNTRLSLQGGCGGCVLLDERACTSHDHRPDHCRMFPFHVYFGRSVEVLADRVCPGVDVGDEPGPHVQARSADTWREPRAIDEAALEQLASASVEELRERARHVQQVHEAVEAQARAEDAWTDPDAAILEQLSRARVTPRAWTNALEPFGVDHDAQLPTTVIPREDGFEWRAWRIRDDELTLLRFDERGKMHPVETANAPTPPDTLGPTVLDVLEELANLEAFVGTAMHLVDDELSTVETAIQRRLDDVAAGLALHAQLLDAEGLDVSKAWLRSVYEPEFYALETLGEWL